MNIIVVTNMYPSEERPGYGIFVKKIKEALEAEHTVLLISLNQKINKTLAYVVFIASIVYKSFLTKDAVIYTHTSTHSCLAVAIVKLVLKKKVVTHVHGGDFLLEHVGNPLYKKILRFFFLFALNLSDNVIVPSRFIKHGVLQLRWNKKAKLHVSPSGGVSKVFFNPKTKKSRLFKCFRAITVSRAEAGKGLETILDLATISKSVNFTIICEGDGIININKRIEQERIDNVQVFSGLGMDEIAKFLHDSDVFIFPSQLKESLGLVGLEAMAAGLPVISRVDCGIAEYLADGYNGFAIDPFSVDSFKDALNVVRTMDDDDYQKLADNCIATAEKFSDESTQEGLMKVFNEQI